MYEYVLSEKDYKTFLLHQVMRQKMSKTIQFYISVSFPTVLLLSVIYFNLYKNVWLLLLLLSFASAWFLLIKKKIWPTWLMYKIEKNIFPTLKVKRFSKIKLEVREECFILREEDRVKKVVYKQVRGIRDFQTLLILEYCEESLIIPKRIFEQDGSEKIKKLVSHILKQRGDEV